MIIYTDAQTAELAKAGISFSVILQAASADIPHDKLAELAATSPDIAKAIAEHVAAAELAAARLKSLPIKPRRGNDEGSIGKAGKPRKASGGLIDVDPSPYHFRACVPSQIASILTDPITAIKTALEVESGQHDGQGHHRDPKHSCEAQLKALLTYFEQIPTAPPGAPQQPEQPAAAPAAA